MNSREIIKHLSKYGLPTELEAVNIKEKADALGEAFFLLCAGNAQDSEVLWVCSSTPEDMKTFILNSAITYIESYTRVDNPRVIQELREMGITNAEEYARVIKKNAFSDLIVDLTQAFLSEEPEIAEGFISRAQSLLERSQDNSQTEDEQSQDVSKTPQSPYQIDSQQEIESAQAIEEAIESAERAVVCARKEMLENRGYYLGEEEWERANEEAKQKVLDAITEDLEFDMPDRYLS